MKKRFFQCFVVGVMLSALMGCCNVGTTDQFPNDVSRTEPQGSHMGKGLGWGALAGAIAGAAISHNDRASGAAIGAVLGGGTGALVGRRMDNKEALMRQRLAATEVQVERKGNSLLLTAPGDVAFRHNDADISPEFYAALNQVARGLQGDRGVVLKVIGHTDDRGSFEYNQKLSEARAYNVAKYLNAQGVPAGRLQAYGFGARQPVADNGTESGRQSNRRVQMIIAPLKS